VDKKGKVRLPRSGDVRETCTKLRGMSYLIELCGNLPCTPLDEDVCFEGVGMILKDIHDEFLHHARTLDLWEIQREQRRSKKMEGSISSPSE